MSFKKISWVDKKSYKNHTQKIFRSKDTTNKKINEILINNLLTNLKTISKLR